MTSLMVKLVGELPERRDECGGRRDEGEQNLESRIQNQEEKKN